MLSTICKLCFIGYCAAFFNSKPVKNGDDYGVDVTFPIHHMLDLKTDYGQQYHRMIKGCYDAYSRRECDLTEEQRIDMNLKQPRSQFNYTELGFKKMKAPPGLWEAVRAYFDKNRDRIARENWPRGNTYTNHWEAPTEFVSVEDPSLGGGQEFKTFIWEAMKPVLEEWVGEDLLPTSLYGIRIYRNNAILSTRMLLFD